MPLKTASPVLLLLLQLSQLTSCSDDVVRSAQQDAAQRSARALSDLNPACFRRPPASGTTAATQPQCQTARSVGWHDAADADPLAGSIRIQRSTSTHALYAGG
eukprot:CAMPEP_0172169760 /NCGR_PEP_ID=MMETSP1050-20130122/10883_1 /TAXON_ID=233186 /ORGANISM="Cryptomonas curvata, Strain CCAP979/52" /LENGTH=102 /DNA_ID=CAMNT_0012840851 /DNA_START=282 /DNA_END=586 /DNA_ORIENTATION=-